jgi:hypothetical protein
VAFDPETDLDRIATDPGVYLMKDREGVIFYVGKAANLRARLRQYFGATSDRRFFVGLLDRLLADVEVVITLTEKEALILENELIKKHQPRFNVELKDDKSFLHLRIDDRAEWPRIDVVRRPKKDGARYFGPYHSASKIRETLKVVERHFQLRNCDDLTFRNRARPCLQYQIKRCPGPCVLPVDRDEYQRGVQAVALFLQGKRGELVATSARPDGAGGGGPGVRARGALPRPDAGRLGQPRTSADHPGRGHRPGRLRPVPPGQSRRRRRPLRAQGPAGGVADVQLRRSGGPGHGGARQLPEPVLPRRQRRARRGRAAPRARVGRRA